MSRCQTSIGSAARAVTGAAAIPWRYTRRSLEGRDELRHRVEERERALLVEHHRRDRRDRLGHRVDAPDRVGLDRQAGLGVALPAVRDVGDPPAARDDQQRALVAPVGHEAVEVGVQPREALGIQPDLLRLRPLVANAAVVAIRRLPRSPPDRTRPSLRDAGSFTRTDDGRRPRVAGARRAGGAPGRRRRPRRAARGARGAKAGMAALTLGALGVVFGDIGTSPLYALQTVFAADHHAVRPTAGRRLRRDLARLLGDHDHRLDQVRDASSCAPTTRARAGSWP